MRNCIIVNGKTIELTAEQVKQIADACQEDQIQLSGVPAGEIVRIGEYEFIVLEQSGDTTALIKKDLLPTLDKFGKNNNYDGSNVDKVCNKFAEELTAVVGEKNLVEHRVDLTTDDGLKDYGSIRRRASLLTSDLYRRYVEILDKFKPKKWWWLATAHSTKKHDNDYWVKCVSPSGYVGNDYCDYDGNGVRPYW